MIWKIGETIHHAAIHLYAGHAWRVAINYWDLRLPPRVFRLLDLQVPASSGTYARGFRNADPRAEITVHATEVPDVGRWLAEKWPTDESPCPGYHSSIVGGYWWSTRGQDAWKSRQKSQQRKA